MSTTAVRMNSHSHSHSHAPSPSYVPRTASRPNSPALPPRPQTSHAGHSRSSSTSRLETSLHARPMSMAANMSSIGSPGLGSAPTPRMGGMERSSSGLRNEVKSSGKADAGKESAKAILKILSSLPAPLPETLPPTFLPTPAASPSSSTSSPPQTFSEYVHSSASKRNKRKFSDSDSSSDELSPTGNGNGIGLGLGLSMSPETRKRQRTDGRPDLVRSASSSSVAGRSLTPMASSGLPGSSPALASKKLGQSSLRNQVTDEKEEGKETWSREQWREAGQAYRARALLLKRHGDAYQRTHSAHSQYTSTLPHDPIKGLLCLTDAVLLWLYAYFCDEQGGGRVRSSPYNESAPLRDFVRRGWESEMRKAPEEEEGRKQGARAMVGLMHLIEAVVCYHLTSEQLAHLSKRGRELASASTPTPTNHGPSPRSATSASPPGTAPLPPSNGGHHVSPPARSSSSSSHHSPESATSYSLPPDLLPLISTSTSSSSRAAQHLLTSRHHLSLNLLRSQFPKTFEYALSSELNDEALPVPGDILGSARRVDVDRPERFAWPIELGMCAPIAHTVAFGRCLVEEAADGLGKEWSRRLE
ncbi:hypothetical protein I316_07451 [Kwoniella heveanensis BCC8398]|uniref:Uncharacterized protein n=1 Tax=Kwoniella heveanensis BCC8398 TaxID=1296120 RepID=A0A1B9GJ14_9TREE|nr:hypothetical protein I316_07451 [Kwoniella heveanensis BCC8398]